MAKKNKENARVDVRVRIKRTESYAEKVRLMFAQTVNNILAMNKKIPTLDEGVMFSFDGESMKIQKEVEAALRQLHSAATMAIRRGITLEWDIANEECDKLINSVFGKRILESPEFSAWANRNESARDAFMNRSEKGMNLSDRVWKSVRQLRDEMEVAMTVAIGEGDSASAMSRKVRQYLNNPDDMFRRFRYKKGEEDIVDPETGEVIGKKPIYGSKWKKKVRDEQTGKVRFIDYDRSDYKTGAGVYKSSAKNAMRVTRTETNMAYRRADNARWQGMDFVLGQHIETSHSHDEDKKDICDKLQGDYPKDFRFDGWHPQCYCVCTPILMDASEMAKVTEAFLKGETYIPKGKQITDYPQGFKDWVTENKGKILNAHDEGKDPYFIKYNYGIVDEIMNPDKVKKKTPLEIAEERHNARTPEQIDEITKKARFRDKSIKTAQRYLDEFKGVDGVDVSALQDAYNHGRWDDIRSEALKLAQTKRGIIENSIAAINKGKDFGEVDITKLQSILKAKDSSLKALQSATRLIEDEIKQMEIFENSISDLIPNAHTLHQSYSMKELQESYNELDGVMKKWLSKYRYSSVDAAPLEHLRNKLDFELTNPTIGYTHKEIIKKAITEKIQVINQKIEWNDMVAKVPSLQSFKTKSTVYKDALAKIDDAIRRNDFAALQKSIEEAENQQQKLIEQQIKRGGNSALNKEYKGAATGKDITSSVDTSKMTSEDPYNGTYTNNVARMQGFDAPAKLVSETEFEMLAKVSGDVFYRTVNPTTFKGKKMSSKEFASQLYVADLLELNGPGGRVHGDGMYVATSAWDGYDIHPLSDSGKRRAYGSSICYGDGSHTISEMTWVRKPKIIKATELAAKWNKLSSSQRAKFGGHKNTYGVALGYDGMYCSGVDYLVIWNRSIIAVKKQ